MKNSNIEWTTHTFNPWIGCTKVSPGCKNCYAETLDRNRFSKTMDGGTKKAPISHWGKGAPRHRTSAAMWKQPLAWNKEAAAAKAAHDAEDLNHAPYRRPRVFCASLADWLDDEVPIVWLADLLSLWFQCQNLDILALTKRPENFRVRVLHAAMYMAGYRDGQTSENPTAGVMPGWEWVLDWVKDGKAPANVWIGTSVEDQPRADERIPPLLRIPARSHFLSMEPLLGPVRLGGALYSDYDKAARQDQLITPPGGFKNAKVNWVIVGGESGPGARPMHPQWARDLRDECEEAVTHFFFKQWGGWREPIEGEEYDTGLGRAGSPPAFIVAPDSTVHCFHSEHTSGGIPMVCVGKNTAGRLLDGHEWNEIPNGGAK